MKNESVRSPDFLFLNEIVGAVAVCVAPLLITSHADCGQVLGNNFFLFSFLTIAFIGCFSVCFRFSNYIENYLHNQRLKEIIAALEIWANKKLILQI